MNEKGKAQDAADRGRVVVDGRGGTWTAEGHVVMVPTLTASNGPYPASAEMKVENRCSRRAAVIGAVGLLVAMGRGASRGLGVFANTPSVAGETEAGPCLPVDGPPVRASFVGFDAAGEIRLRIPEPGASEPQMLAKGVDDLVSWGSCPDLRPGQDYLFLVDGTLLSGVWQGLDNGVIQWRHERIGGLQVPTEQASGLVVAAPFAASARDRLLDRIASGNGEYDRLILTNGDELRGRVLRGDASAVQMLSDFGAVDVPTSRVAAVGLRGPGVRRFSPGAVVLGLEDGSRLAVAPTMSGRYPLEVDLPVGKDGERSPLHRVRLTDRPTQPETWEFLAAVKYLHAFGRRVDYLSDRAPTEYVHVPYLTYVQPLGRDRTPRGAFLRSEGALYLKGLGTYSACRVTYSPAKQYRRFRAEVVMDDAARGRGDAACRALVDGATAWRTESLRSADTPTIVDLDVSGAERLDLIVEFGPRADELDYVDWLNARLIR